MSTQSLTIDKIFDTVCDVFGVKPEHLKGNSRKPKYAFARFAFAQLVKEADIKTTSAMSIINRDRTSSYKMLDGYDTIQKKIADKMEECRSRLGINKEEPKPSRSKAEILIDFLSGIFRGLSSPNSYHSPFTDYTPNEERMMRIVCYKAAEWGL